MNRGADSRPADAQREPRPTDGFRQLAAALDWEGFDLDCAQCARPGRAALDAQPVHRSNTASAGGRAGPQTAGSRPLRFVRDGIGGS